MPAVTTGLGHMDAPAGVPLCVVGVHGGAGASTIAQLAGGACGRLWPVPHPYEPAARVLPVVLVTRTHAAGLLAAQVALTQWAGGGVDPRVNLLGLALVADAPGRLPRALRDLMKVISGGAPRRWELPWSESLRLGDPDPKLPRQYKNLVSELRSLASAPVDEITSLRKE